MHAAAGFSLLLGLGAECNFMSATLADASDWRWFRRTVIQLVVATDPARGEATAAEFEAVSGGGRDKDPWTRAAQDAGTAEASLTAQLAMLLHAASIAHLTKPLEQHRKWAGMLHSERSAQADMMIAVSSACGDRAASFAAAKAATGAGTAARPRAQAAAQVKLIESVAVPAFRALAVGYYGLGYPAAATPPWDEHLAANTAFWKTALLAEIEKPKPLQYTKANPSMDATPGGRGRADSGGLSPAYAARLDAALDESDDDSEPED